MLKTFRKQRKIGMLAVKGVYKDGKIELVESLPSEIKEAEVYIVIVPQKGSDEDFFNYNLDDDVKEKKAWAVTSANAVSEWKNPEEEEVWK